MLNGRETILWLVTTIWLAVGLGGVWVWERHEATPGSIGEAYANVGPVGRWQLTVYAHPHCPCTKATLAEVKALADAFPDLDVRVRIVRPTGSPDGWERGPTWDAAVQIPGCDVAGDDGGREARQHGAETSGHAVLADPAGRAVFRGGLTVGRGRKGNGRNPVRAWLAGAEAAPGTAPVYGCSLRTPNF